MFKEFISDEKLKIEQLVDLKKTNLKILFTKNIDISSIKNKHFIKFEIKKCTKNEEDIDKLGKIDKFNYFNKLFLS